MDHKIFPFSVQGPGPRRPGFLQGASSEPPPSLGGAELKLHSIHWDGTWVGHVEKLF